MQLGHAHTLAQARTYVAALADAAGSEDASSAYEHVLIELDRLHGDQSPDGFPDGPQTACGTWFGLAHGAIEELREHQADALGVELILARLRDAHAQDAN